MSTVRELIAYLGFDVEEEKISRFDALIAGARKSVLGLIGAVTGATAGAVAAAVQTAKTGKEYELMAARVGVGVDAFQRLGYAAQRTAVDGEELRNALFKLSANAEQVRLGNKEAAKSFASVGLSVTDVHGKLKPADELFLEFADKIAKLPAGGERANAAMKLMGRGGAALVPLLAKGREGIEKYGKEAEKLGVILSADTLEKSGKFLGSWGRAKNAMLGLTYTVGAAVIPILTKLTDRWGKSALANQKWVSTRIEKAIGLFSGALDVALGMLDRVEDAAKKVIDAFGGLDRIAKVVAFTLGVVLLNSLGKVRQDLALLFGVLKWAGPMMAGELAKDALMLFRVGRALGWASVASVVFSGSLVVLKTVANRVLQGGLFGILIAEMIDLAETFQGKRTVFRDIGDWITKTFNPEDFDPTDNKLMQALRYAVYWVKRVGGDVAAMWDVIFGDDAQKAMARKHLEESGQDVEWERMKREGTERRERTKDWTVKGEGTENGPPVPRNLLPGGLQGFVGPPRPPTLPGGRGGNTVVVQHKTEVTVGSVDSPERAAEVGRIAEEATQRAWDKNLAVTAAQLSGRFDR